MNDFDEQDPRNSYRQDAGHRGPKLRVVEPTSEALPPTSKEAEEHVLACCLVDAGQTLARCLREKISVDAFYFPALKRIFQTLVEMQREQLPISMEVLAEELRRRRELENVGGFPYLLQLTAEVPTTTHAGYFIDKLREKWVLRRLQRYGTELMEGINSFADGDLENFSCRHAVRLQRVADFVTRLKRPGIADETKLARAKLEDLLSGKIDRTRRLSLGTAYADEKLLPLDVKNEDWFVVLCAPPSGGKSTLAKQIVRENCAAGKRGAVFLLETGKERWQWSLASARAKVSLRLALDHPEQLPIAQLKRLLDEDAAIAPWFGETLWVYDDVYNIEDIERTVRELDRALREKDIAAVESEVAAGRPRREPRGLDFVVVDYLQLMSTRERINKREEYVAHLSRSCKKLFKSLDLTGIVLSQLNRKARDEERRPRLSDLRESGAIEQDADCVLAVHTPAKDRAGQDQDGERTVKENELILLKRRNGPANLAIDLLLYADQGRYQDAVHKGELRPGQPKPAEGYKRPGSGV